MLDYWWAVLNLHFNHTELNPVPHMFDPKQKNKTDFMLEWETLAAETFEKVMQEISCFQLSSREMLLWAVANMETAPGLIGDW